MVIYKTQLIYILDAMYVDCGDKIICISLARKILMAQVTQVVVQRN